jgi:anti-sigma factor RsiW
MHPNETTLNEFVDGALDPAAAREVEQHLASCAECRRVVDDLREITRTAASLDPRQPPARAWSRIERAIRLEAHDAETRAVETTGAARRRFSRGVISALAAAAVLVIAAVVGIRYAAQRPAPREDAASSAVERAEAEASAAAVEAELRAAEAHYDKAIKGLEQIAASEQNVFDPKTAATLQKNLAVIDQAISESRAAVRSQPTSEPARQSLMESFRTKLTLLQDTVALINEMRKGNDAGAARAVSGLKQKGD